MKPYKVYNTWVDLDSIVEIGPIYGDIYYGAEDRFCDIQYLFVDTKKRIQLDFKLYYYIEDKNASKIREEICNIIAKQRYDKFVEAWKNKDKK